MDADTQTDAEIQVKEEDKHLMEPFGTKTREDQNDKHVERHGNSHPAVLKSRSRRKSRKPKYLNDYV